MNEQEPDIETETDNSSVLKIKNLRRNFGDCEALKGISFELTEGKITGFIGANGAGKTTTMRIICGLDIPDSGEVTLDDVSVHAFPALIRQCIGWMPDYNGKTPHITVWEYLDFYAKAYGFRAAKRRSVVNDVIEFNELGALANKDVTSLSKGMTQRLSLSRMLLADPPILIMDEPAAGLDPKARIELKHLLRLLAEQGKSILISSHILSELDDISDSLLFIDHGTIIHSGGAAELKRQTSSQTVIRIKTTTEDPKLRPWLELYPDIEYLETIKRGCVIAVEDDNEEKIHHILGAMIKEGFAIVDFHKEEQRLEEAFIALVEANQSSMEEE